MKKLKIFSLVAVVVSLFMLLSCEKENITTNVQIGKTQFTRANVENSTPYSDIREYAKEQVLKFENAQLGISKRRNVTYSKDNFDVLITEISEERNSDTYENQEKIDNYYAELSNDILSKINNHLAIQKVIEYGNTIKAKSPQTYFYNDPNSFEIIVGNRTFHKMEVLEAYEYGYFLSELSPIQYERIKNGKETLTRTCYKVGKTWKEKEMPIKVRFGNSATDHIISGMRIAMNKITTNVPSITFTEIKNNSTNQFNWNMGFSKHVRVIACEDENVGGYSTIGSKLWAKIEISENYNQDRTCVHEMCHVLALVHEHQRPDRDNYITIHEDRILAGYEYAFEKYDINDYAVYGDFDLSSIMLYFATAFTTGGYTITTKNGGYIAPTKHLSSKDIAGLKYLYNF